MRRLFRGQGIGHRLLAAYIDRVRSIDGLARDETLRLHEARPLPPASTKISASSPSVPNSRAVLVAGQYLDQEHMRLPLHGHSVRQTIVANHPLLRGLKRQLPLF